MDPAKAKKQVPKIYTNIVLPEVVRRFIRNTTLDIYSNRIHARCEAGDYEEMVYVKKTNRWMPITTYFEKEAKGEL